MSDYIKLECKYMSAYIIPNHHHHAIKEMYASSISFNFLLRKVKYSLINYM